MMVLPHQRISSRSSADTFSSVAILLTATTILSGRTIEAGCINWDLVLTLAIVSVAPSEAVVLTTVLTSHFIVAPMQNLNDKNEDVISSGQGKTEVLHRLAEENLRPIVRPSIKNTFSEKESNIREFNKLLTRTVNESKRHSFSKFLVNAREIDSLDFNSRTHGSPSEDKASDRRRSADTNMCPEIKFSKFCKCSESSLNCDNLNLSFLIFDGPLPKEMKSISVMQNHLSEIPEIIGAGNLIEMTLAHNNIRDANMTILGNFQFLEILDLSSNEIEVLDLTSVEHLNLRVLHVSSNKLVKFLTPTLPLTDLFLDKNNLKDVSFLMNFPNLQKLNISYNQITFIPENVFQNISDLRTLDLRNNQIVNADFLSFIPKYLMTLVLSNNKISYIHAQTFRNKYLVDLSIDNNLLTDISFVIYLNVARLKLNKNPLYQINSHYLEIRNLRFLDVSGTNLTSINFIHKITSLIELRIEDNNITLLPKVFFENYSSLRRLFLRGNPLKDLTCSDPYICLDKGICDECKHCTTLGDVVIFLKDEDLNCNMNCVTNSEYRKFTKKCVLSNSSSQIFIPVFLMLFLIVIDVL